MTARRRPISPGRVRTAATAGVARGSRAGAVGVLGLALVMLVTACGGSSSDSSSKASTSLATSTAAPSTIKLAQATPPPPGPAPHPTRFALEAGLAFGIFHQDVTKPFKAGALESPRHHKRARAAAAAATLAALQEAEVAKRFAQGDSSLRKLFAPMAALEATLSTLAQTLERGHLDRADIVSADLAIANIERSAGSSGVKIAERAPAKAA